MYMAADGNQMRSEHQWPAWQAAFGWDSTTVEYLNLYPVIIQLPPLLHLMSNWAVRGPKQIIEDVFFYNDNCNSFSLYKA